MKKKHQSNPLIKIIGGFLFLLILVVLTRPIWNPKPDSPPISSTSKPVVQFLKEGLLVFKNSNSDTLATIDIEIADDFEQRRQGLMYRDQMDENQGMLFIFDYESQQSFWMKNTPITLDILFVNTNKEIVKIHEFTVPFYEGAYPSEKPAIYVVEVVGGFCKKYNIKPGDSIEFLRL